MKSKISCPFLKSIYQKFNHSRLNGKTNTVYTGVAIKYGDHIETFTEATKVQFGNFTDEQIKAYVDTGEPL